MCRELALHDIRAPRTAHGRDWVCGVGNQVETRREDGVLALPEDITRRPVEEGRVPQEKRLSTGQKE